MTTAQGGFGLVMKIDVSSTLTAIVGLEDVDFPTFRKFIAEATAHDSAGGFYEAVATGKRRVESITATMFWDDTQATHQAVRTGFDSDDPVDCSIEDPDGQEVIAFSAHIEAISRISKQQDAYKAQVEFHPTGQPTIS